MSLERVNALLGIRVYRMGGTTISPTMRLASSARRVYGYGDSVEGAAFELLAT